MAVFAITDQYQSSPKARLETFQTGPPFQQCAVHRNPRSDLSPALVRPPATETLVPVEVMLTIAHLCARLPGVVLRQCTCRSPFQKQSYQEHTCSMVWKSCHRFLLPCRSGYRPTTIPSLASGNRMMFENSHFIRSDSSQSCQRVRTAGKEKATGSPGVAINEQF